MDGNERDLICLVHSSAEAEIEVSTSTEQDGGPPPVIFDIQAQL
jgi:hypothetical protein